MDKIDPQSITEEVIQARLAAEVIRRIIERRAHMELSAPIRIERRPITDFMRRMRATSLEKFDTETYLSVINFFEDSEAMRDGKPNGTMILYVEGDFIYELLRKMEYPVEEDDDEETVLDATGTLCNLIAGNFKAGLTQIGYEDLEMSHFMSYRNSIPEGAAYPNSEKEKFEISFEIDRQKRIVLDLVMQKDLPKYI